jgi:hypothetical protein
MTKCFQEFVINFICNCAGGTGSLCRDFEARAPSVQCGGQFARHDGQVIAAHDPPPPESSGSQALASAVRPVGERLRALFSMGVSTRFGRPCVVTA